MLTKEEAGSIERAIRNAEAKTSTEIVVWILRSSGEDRGIAAIAGALMLLLVLGVTEIIQPAINLFLSLGIAFALAVIVFVACDRLNLGLRILPARLVARDARRAARAVFLDRELDATPERNAVLLFISRAERYVEILPDRGLAAAVPAQRWANIVTSFQKVARQKGVAEAAADAVGRIGAVCAGPFPADAANPDLISNKPVAE